MGVRRMYREARENKGSNLLGGKRLRKGGMQGLLCL